MRYLIAIAILGIWGACANYATFQEADVLHRGTTKFGVGGTATTYKERDENGEIDSIRLPAVNLWVRRGLIDKLEAHAHVWIPFGSSVGVKYQLIGNREMSGLAFSIGLDFGALQSGSGDNKYTLIDTYVPLYIGYRLHPAFAVYGSPKYILRTGFGQDSTEISHLTGGTFGIALGARTTLHLEGTVMYDFGLDAPAFQAGVGVAF